MSRRVADAYRDLMEDRRRPTWVVLNGAVYYKTHLEPKDDEPRVALSADASEIDDEMIDRGAEAIDDLLVQLGVEPTYAPEHAPLDTIKRVLSRAVFRAALPRQQLSEEDR